MREDILSPEKKRENLQKGKHMIWNESKECMSRDEMQNLQSKRLVKLVDRVYHNVEYYRKKMQQAGLEPGDIRGSRTCTACPTPPRMT